MSRFTFLANAFVPADGLPSGLREVAEYNPVSTLVAAARTLFGNPTALPARAPWPLQHPVAGSVLCCGALLAIGRSRHAVALSRAYPGLTLAGMESV
jgi:ABC-2 type transport system permease protein